MEETKFSLNQTPISTILAWVESGEIAIPEIQRPFVWTSSQVRDLMDSLYQGYPVGYIITWQNPDVRLKDGSTSQGKRIFDRWAAANHCFAGGDKRPRCD